jgi:hypothetical protein
MATLQAVIFDYGGVLRGDELSQRPSCVGPDNTLSATSND